MMQTAYEADLTVRITKMYKSYKKIDTSIRFSAVPVDKLHHTVTSKIDHYTIKARDTISPEPAEGEIWLIQGSASYEQTKSHNGKYFIKKHHVNVETAKLILPKNPVGFISFIAETPHFKGVGDTIAAGLWEKFKGNTYNILKNGEVSKLLTIKGLGKTSANSLISGYKKFSYLKYSKYFTKHEIPVPIQKRIYKFKGIADGSLIQSEKDGIKFDPNPVNLINKNPYSLSTFGMSFNQNDRIAKKHFGVKDDDPRRLIAAVTQCLTAHAKDGHTITHHKQLASPLRDLLHQNEPLVTKALSQAYDKRAFVIYPDSGIYQFTPTYIMENVVAKRLLKLHNQGEIDNEAKDAACESAFQATKFPLEPQQTKAIKTSISYAVSCITGGAGTGKTTVLNSVLHAYSSLNYHIKAVALSGRAAQQMHQSIKRETSTIAKFLREKPIEDIGEQKYLLVIDESSMLDLPTMYKIIIHIDPNVRILFVGDPNQLPPIGAGNILYDLVKSEVIQNTELDIVKRQGAGTGIPEYSNLINEGLVPPKLSTGSITFHEAEFDYVEDVCVGLYKQDPENSRVVAATNKLVQKINVLCQKELNPEGKQLVYDKDGEKLFDYIYENDPVLFTQNNYDAHVQNGSLGKLISVEEKGGHFGVVQIDDFEKAENEFVSLTSSLLLSLKPGYCITLHKAQGSQFPRVIVALSSGGNLDRAWLYTAVTRAEIELHIVGPKAKMISAIRNVSNASKRQTNLVNLLQKK
jgi:exodeoxyribonuclease V alpha subunit